MARCFRVLVLIACLVVGTMPSRAAVTEASTPSGQIVTQAFIDGLLETPSTQQAMAIAFQRQMADDIDGLRAHLQSLSPLIQEATLFRLLSTPTRLDNPDWRTFLRDLSHQQPHFLLRHQQDGYWVTTPAFHYAAAARQQLNRYQHEQLTQELGILLSYRQLVIADWVKPDGADYARRRDALVAMIGDYEANGLAYLAEQYLHDPRLLWLPDNAILAVLAEKTQHPELYARLWRRGTDAYSLEALHALKGQVSDSFSVSQMMAAARNPSLRDTAIRQLASLSPLPAPVADFLVAQLSLRQGDQVAQLLVEAGKGEWLTGLQAELGPLGRQHIASALSSR